MFDKEKTIFCSCGLHIIQIAKGIGDDDMSILFYELRSDEGASSFWHKLCVAWKYVFKNEGHCEYDVVLNKSEQESLLKAIKDLMEEHEKDIPL